MFVKYNSLLRGFPADVVKGCLGNGCASTADQTRDRHSPALPCRPLP